MFTIRIIGIALVFLSSFQAKSQNGDLPALRETEVAQLDCPEAMKQLDQRIQFQAQINSSFLEVNETLENAYRTWGARLAKELDPKELKEISAFLLRSAEALAKAQAINQSTVETLEKETKWLKGRVKNCVDSASNGFSVPVKTIEIYPQRLTIVGEPSAGKNVRAIISGLIGICSKYEGIQLEQTLPGQHKLVVKAKQYSCMESANVTLFSKEIDLGNFKEGSHKIRSYGPDKEFYSETTFEVKP